MAHPATPLPNDDSWSTGDEGFDGRIKLSLDERDALLKELKSLVTAVVFGLHPEEVREAVSRARAAIAKVEGRS